MADIPELTNNEFEKFIREGIVLIDFFAEWCMPCLMLSPVLEELNEKFEGKIKFGKVNVEDNQILAQKFRISSIPNLTILKDGKVVEQIIGALPLEEIENRLNKHL
jgi:thioredoxin 1